MGRKKKADGSDQKKQKEENPSAGISTNFSGESFNSSKTSRSTISSIIDPAIGNLENISAHSAVMDDIPGKSPTPPIFEPHPTPSEGPFFVLIRSNDQLSQRRINCEKIK